MTEPTVNAEKSFIVASIPAYDEENTIGKIIIQTLNYEEFRLRVLDGTVRRYFDLKELNRSAVQVGSVYGRREQ